MLKKLVNEENDQNGKVHIRLPAADDSESESSEDESEVGEMEEAEPTVAVRSTRSSLAKSQAAELRARAAVEAKLHNGNEIDQCVKNYGWKQRLRKRDFANSRWIVIIVGLLNAFTTHPKRKPWCDKILGLLAPPQMRATEDGAISRYSELDISGRVEILQFLCMLTLDTPAIRTYMEDCTTSMTEYRKVKMDHQRSRKQ